MENEAESSSDETVCEKAPRALTSFWWRWCTWEVCPNNSHTSQAGCYLPLTTTAACILPWTGHHTIHTDKFIASCSLTKSSPPSRSFIHLLIRKTCTCVLHSSIFCCGWFPSSSAADPEIHCIHYIFLVQEVNTGNHAGFLHLLLAICNMCHRICRFYDC